MKKNKQPDSITEITIATLNGVTYLLIAENKGGVITYKYQTYNLNNKFKLFKVENYLIINGVKWENIENINISTVGETMRVIDDALSHGFSFLVRNHRLYYKEEVK